VDKQQIEIENKKLKLEKAKILEGLIRTLIIAILTIGAGEGTLIFKVLTLKENLQAFIYKILLVGITTLLILLIFILILLMRNLHILWRIK